MRIHGGGLNVLRHVCLCTLLMCGCRMFKVSSTGPVDVILRNGREESVWAYEFRQSPDEELKADVSHSLGFSDAPCHKHGVHDEALLRYVDRLISSDSSFERDSDLPHDGEYVSVKRLVRLATYDIQDFEGCKYQKDITEIKKRACAYLNRCMELSKLDIRQSSSAELLLPCNDALPDCLWAGEWPETISSQEMKAIVEELVDMYWHYNYFEFLRKGVRVEKPVVASELGDGTYGIRTKISKETVAMTVQDGISPFQPGFALSSIYGDRRSARSANAIPESASMGETLAWVSENYGVKYLVRDGKIVIVPSRIENGSHFGKEYEDLVKALMAKCREWRLPYGKSMVSWWNAFDKSRQEEYAKAKNGEVLPLGYHSHKDIIENRGDIPRSFVGRLRVSLGKDRKCLLHTIGGSDRILCTVDSSANAVLKVRMENVDTDQEKISVVQLPPSSDLPERGIAEGEMLLVFTPHGLFARPWYSRQFNYYWFEPGK